MAFGVPYKIKNLLGNDSRYPSISHKKCFVPNIDPLDFVGKIWGGILLDLVLQICEVDGAIPSVDGDFTTPTWAQHILITASIYIGNVDQVTRMFPVGCSLVGFTCMDFKPPAFASKTFEIGYLDLLGVFVQFEFLFAPT